MVDSESGSLAEIVRRINEAGGAYHRMDLGAGLVIEGEYDLTGQLHHYGFPEDLHGQRVLDAGTASGFFAVELARRGAEVVAIDIWPDHDLPRIARELDLPIEYVQQDVLELEPSFGRFDLVFCGSLLLHLWNPFEALCRLRAVCSHQIIVATALMSKRHLGFLPWPLAELKADKRETPTGEYWTTWLPNKAALVRLVRAAGFERVEYQGSFKLRSAPGKSGFSTPHGIVHAEIAGPAPGTPKR